MKHGIVTHIPETCIPCAAEGWSASFPLGLSVSTPTRRYVLYFSDDNATRIQSLPMVMKMVLVMVVAAYGGNVAVAAVAPRMNLRDRNWDCRTTRATLVFRRQM